MGTGPGTRGTVKVGYFIIGIIGSIVQVFNVLDFLTANMSHDYVGFVDREEIGDLEDYQASAVISAEALDEVGAVCDPLREVHFGDPPISENMSGISLAIHRVDSRYTH